jgi:hypothetical protein
MGNHLIDFEAVDRAALARGKGLLPWITPEGEQRGDEWVALNPHRDDRKLGSFLLNLRTGMWSDFATNDSGCGVISYYAFVDGIRPYEAARRLNNALGGGYV